MSTIAISIDSEGNGHCLYTEQIDLRAIGPLQIARASHIEFNNETMEWEVKDLENRPLFQHTSRSACLAWEQQHFNV
jgi:hypothetical protein